MGISQNGEDEVIIGFLEREWPTLTPESAVALDIGANDGVRLSNTRRLAMLGWSCLLVEADPTCVTELIENIRRLPRCKAMAAAVTPRLVPDRIIPLHLSLDDGLYSTADSGNRRKWAAKMTGDSIAVAALTVKDLLREGGAFVDRPGDLRPDVISIDIEGGSYAVLSDFQFEEWPAAERPKVIVCEHDGLIAEIEMRFAAMGYRVLMVNAENIVLGRTP